MRTLLLSGLLLLTGCSTGADLTIIRPCTSDSECDSGLVCFAEGCGDPGKGLVVEVAGTASSTQFVKDMPIIDGTLAPAFDFALGDPLMIVGEFQRELTAKVDPANRSAYLQDVRLQALGTSELIPGVSRSFEQRIVAPVRGTYQMSLGSGLYTLTATPVDPSVPPLTTTNVAVRAGAATPEVDFAFPSLEGAITLSGRLLKNIDATQVPSVELALTSSGTAMDLQAFDSSTHLALSQRFPVSSGQAGANGNFTITMSPLVATLDAFSLLATPREAGSPVPSKSFVVMTPVPDTVTLELGDPGPVMTLKGVAKTSAGAPIANAQVIIDDNLLPGSATFRSKLTTTDATGAFTLDTLGGNTELTIVPPPDSVAGVTHAFFTLPPSTTTPVPSTFTCVDRVLVSGLVFKPDGTAAAGVGVHAIERAATAGSTQPLTLDNVDAVTDFDGAYTLHLDPAVWRLEFYAGSKFPMVSRLVTLDGTDIYGVPNKTQVVEAVKLATGRTVQGAVTGTVAQTAVPLPYATLRFFRVAPVGGTSVATLIGSTVADDKGSYTIVLPDRSAK